MNSLITKQILSLTAAMFILATGTPIQAQVSNTQAAQIKIAVNELVHEYAVARDSNDASGYANTFAETGVLELYGTKYDRDSLRERVESSDPKAVSMHHMATGAINVIDETRATGVHYFTLYTGTKGEDHEDGTAVNVASFTVMGKYYDDYVLTNNGWKFSSRRVEAVFSPK